jgi:hypothetical protein
MRGALIDDVALGTLLKRHGNRIWLGLTTDIRSAPPLFRAVGLLAWPPCWDENALGGRAKSRSVHYEGLGFI